MKHFVAISILSLHSILCFSQSEIDFNFEIKIDCTDEYRSNDQYFKREYIDGFDSIRITISDEEKRSIHEYLINNDLFSFPDEYPSNDCDDCVICIPNCHYRIYFVLQEKRKTIKWSDEYCECDSVKHSVLRRMQKIVLNILRKKDNYKMFKESDLIHL